jgi:hypothetical protein
MKTLLQDVAPRLFEGAKPTGGKALKRLQEFAEARGLAPDGPGPEAGDTAPETPTSAKSRGAAKAAKAAAPASADLADAGMQAAAMLAAAAAAPLPLPLLPPAWRPLGPSEIPNGQTYGASRVTVAGRVAAIAVDPSNRNHLLVGAAGGGIWESFDSGASWAARGDHLPTLTTGAMAFDPGHPATVYCGTGEGNWYWHWGVGVAKSTNGGATWAMQATAPFVGQGFFDLVVDPADGSHLLAATTGGIYRSTDGGLTWTQRHAAICWSLALAPADALAACRDGLFRSTNGGQAWAAVALPGAPASFTRLAVAHARSNPAVAYAFGSGQPMIRIPGDPDPTHVMPTPYLWRRAAAGGAFVAVTPPPTLVTTQSWYDWFLAVAPDNAGEIYLGAIDAYRGDLSGAAWTWTDITSKGAPGSDSIHPDQHAIAVDPVDPNVIYVGNDGGLFRSPDRGIHWAHRNHGLAITEIEYIAQDFGSSRWIMGGTQDNGTERYTGSPVWDHIADGDGGDCSVNHTNPDSVFHTFYGMLVQHSTNRGNSWVSIGPPVPQNYGALFYPPLEVFGDVVARAGQSVFLSRNNGASWVEVALPGNTVATAMHMPSADRVYVGCANGTMFRVDWNGAAWSAANALATPRVGAWVSDIAVNSSNLNRLWVTSTVIGGGRVFRSDNGGAAWVDVSAGLPNLPINSVEIHSSNANRVWVAADLGVYQTTNAGAGWAPFSFGLPNVLVEDLEYHPYARVLRAGTRNRGVWEIPVDGWLVNPVCGVQWTGQLAANQTKQWFTFNWPATWHVVWTVMPVTPKPGAAELAWTVRVERASATMATYWIQVQNLTNVPVTFEGRYCILSYY